MNSMSAKPFAKKTFYLDLKGYAKEAKLAKDLILFGGRQEQFLNKDVSFVVSIRVPAKAQFSSPATPLTNSPLLSPQCFNDSPMDCIGSPAYSPGVDPNPCIMSRGKSLLQKAREKRQGGTSDILEICRQWNIKVYHVQKVVSWIEKHKSLYHKNHVTEQKKGLTRIHLPSENVQKLHSPFIKIEDLNKKYSTKYKELQNWTSSIYLPLSRCVNELLLLVMRDETESNSKESPSKQEDRGFEPSHKNRFYKKLPSQVFSNSSSVSSQKEKVSHNRIKSNKPSCEELLQSVSNNCNASFTKPYNSNMSFSKSPSLLGCSQVEKENVSCSNLKKVSKVHKQKSKKRYCEICRVNFDDLDAHLEGKSHVSYMNNDLHYASVQQIMHSLPSPEDFLMSLSTSAISCESITTPKPSDPSNEDKSSTTELWSSEIISATCSSPSSEVKWPHLERVSKLQVFRKTDENLEPPSLICCVPDQEQSLGAEQPRKRKRSSDDSLGTKSKIMRKETSDTKDEADLGCRNIFLGIDSESIYLHNIQSRVFQGCALSACHSNYACEAEQNVLNCRKDHDSHLNDSLSMHVTEKNGIYSENPILQLNSSILNYKNVLGSGDWENQFMQAPFLMKMDLNSPEINYTFNNIGASNVENELMNPSIHLVDGLINDLGLLSQNSSFNQSPLQANVQTSNLDVQIDNRIELQGDLTFPDLQKVPVGFMNDLKEVEQRSVSKLTCSRNLSEVFKSVVLSKDCQNESHMRLHEFFAKKDKCSALLTANEINTSNSKVPLPNLYLKASDPLVPGFPSLKIDDLIPFSHINGCASENAITETETLSNSCISSHCSVLCEVVHFVDVLVESVVQLRTVENESNVKKQIVSAKQNDVELVKNIYTYNIIEKNRGFDLTSVHSTADAELLNKPEVTDRDKVGDLQSVETEKTLLKLGRNSNSNKDTASQVSASLANCPLDGIPTEKSITEAVTLCNNFSSWLKPLKTAEDLTSSVCVLPEDVAEMLDADGVYYVLDDADESDFSESDCYEDTITICSKGASCEESICCTKLDCLKGRSIAVGSEDISCQEDNSHTKMNCRINQSITEESAFYPLNYSSRDHETSIFLSHSKTDSGFHSALNSSARNNLLDTGCMNVSNDQPQEGAEVAANLDNFSLNESSSASKSYLINDSHSPEANFSSSPEREESWAFIHHEVDVLCKSIAANDDCAMDLSINPKRIESRHLLMQH